MKRKLSLLTASAMLLIGMVLIPLSPASAAPDICIIQGTATTDNPVYYPILGSSATGGVHFGVTIGGCLLNPAAHSGPVHGNFTSGPAGNYCGSSTGQVDAWGHALTWISSGSMLVFSGQGSGSVNAIPNALGPDGSCFTGAKNFLVNGTLFLV